MNKYAIAFDVGGHFIKTAVLDEQGRVMKGTLAIYPSFSQASKEEILDHFVRIIKQQANRILDKRFHIFGVGYAFPGPFDYPGGVCLIRGADKFEHLYGVNLRREIIARLDADDVFAERKTEDFRIVFENDANLFALGEILIGKASRYRRSICLTMGVGTGSAFVDGGALVTSGPGVPPNGWVYNTPFGDSIVDDYFSVRGILRLAASGGVDAPAAEVRSVAELAKSGDEPARRVFHRFGQLLGQMLDPFVRSFRPDAVILGGQIAKYGDLFLAGMKETLDCTDLAVETAEDTSLSTFAGVAKLLSDTRKKTAGRTPPSSDARI